MSTTLLVSGAWSGTTNMLTDFTGFIPGSDTEFYYSDFLSRIPGSVIVIDQKTFDKLVHEERFKSILTRASRIIIVSKSEYSPSKPAPKERNLIRTTNTYAALFIAKRISTDICVMGTKKKHMEISLRHADKVSYFKVDDLLRDGDCLPDIKTLGFHTVSKQPFRVTRIGTDPTLGGRKDVVAGLIHTLFRDTNERTARLNRQQAKEEEQRKLEQSRLEQLEQMQEG